MANVLIVDDEEHLLEVLRTALAAEGHEVVATADPEEAVRVLREDRMDALITDLKMAPLDGLELLSAAKTMDREVAVIMITAYGSIETAVEAMRRGAFDYIIKPVKLDELKMTLDRALAYRGLLRENVSLKRELAGRYRFENIVGTSGAMQDVFRKIEKVADTDSTVLIYGESGTGKELVARALHFNSRRRDKPFVAVSCSALPESLLESELFGHVKGAFTGAVSNREGLFKAAGGGSIFLDEIGATGHAIQASLLRVLQEREIKPVGSTRSLKVDVRVIAASNERLEEKIRAGTFREDLYYRLSVIPIDVPPLRERRGDIPLLVEHFMRRELAKRGRSADLRMSPDVLDMLMIYDWPGNVRELENVIERIVALSEGGSILLDHLPENILMPPEILDATHAVNLKAFVQEKERAYIQGILRETGGDKRQAARILGIDLATLYRKMERWKGGGPPQEQEGPVLRRGGSSGTGSDSNSRLPQV
ncbi:MAG: sigma-54 dependent transcriptional regulator [bacterium]|nr:sigma-54 dependent transcriptional regulator [bacterium]